MASTSPITNNKHDSFSSMNTMSSFNKHKPLPPISRIPGLNPDSEVIASAEQKTFRTFKVLETDSTYIRLAKQGGRKNLLQYNEYSPNENAIVGIPKESKDGLAMKKRPDLLDHQEYKPRGKTPQEKLPLVDSNNNNEMTIDNNNVINNNNNNICSRNGSNGPLKSLMEIKKQSINLKKKAKENAAQKTSPGKERPDILPIDNVEILRHLNVPRKPILPKLKHQQKEKKRAARIGAR